MTGKELLQKYMEQPPEKMTQFLKSLSWEDVKVMSEEIKKQVKAARDAGDTDAILNLVTRSIPFLEYFEDK